MEWRGEAWNGSEWNCVKCNFSTKSDSDMFFHILKNHWFTYWLKEK